MSLSFGVPNGGNGYAAGAAGWWIMVSDMVNLGINLGFAMDNDFGGSGDTNIDFLLAPAVRVYWDKDGDVLPFFHGQANLRLVDTPNQADDPEFSMGVGAGVEWFVVPEFSLAGQVGVNVDLVRPDPIDPVALATFTSGLTAQMYFD